MGVRMWSLSAMPAPPEPLGYGRDLVRADRGGEGGSLRARPAPPGPGGGGGVWGGAEGGGGGGGVGALPQPPTARALRSFLSPGGAVPAPARFPGPPPAAHIALLTYSRSASALP